VYDPGAPPVEERIAGLRALREAGIPLVLRIDPLFPHSPLPGRDGRTLGDFNLPEAQTLQDLESLVALARELHVRHVVYSAAKIVLKRGRRLSPNMQAMREVYRAMAAPQKLDWRGRSWRLPEPIARDHVLQPFLQLCRKYDVVAKHCRQDLIQTP
jgi:DNA repair photolyase